ncbi:MAG: tyrosine-type recombinase/integrase [Thermogemmatispora sp.]|uniref:tyrosine-type recombinase/integrase n=1 Tax=Thermogemmatispora sp. TaxID=1968838 RepID=UPI001A09D786|nr:tyrosine-type recombinase/integrase [Thermogemmatispora sp.]MBE3566026.1 tyrosine-type recombinase/integrase [Thermogemmatispora sp.]
MLQEAVDAYLATLAERGAGINHHTVAAYRNDLSQFSSFLEQKRLRRHWSEVESEDVQAYLEEMRQVRAYQPTTISRKLAALKTFLRHLKSQGLLERNLLETVQAPRALRTTFPVLSAEQLACLLEQIPPFTPTGMRDLAMVQVLYATGMHLTELVALDVSCFDRLYGSLVYPRSDGRLRECPLTSQAIMALEQYLLRSRPYLARRHPEESGLFVNHHGRRLTRQGFWLVVRNYALRAGIAELTPCQLRQSLMLLAIKRSSEPQGIQALLEYAHLSRGGGQSKRWGASEGDDSLLKRG